MRNSSLVLISIFLVSTTIAVSQQRDANFFPFKDLVFAQVAAGGGYETLITLTNRGSQTYGGTLFFYKGAGVAWNPMVNNNPVTGGQVPLSITAGATTSLVITVPGGVEAGFAMIRATNLDQANLLQGTLTYFVKSGGQIVDAIGVLPATQVIATSIPFEDFSNIALAFANTDPQGRTATIRLSLYSATGSPVSTQKTLPLGPLGHNPIYLYQIFTDVTTLHRGRLEIQSDVPISATALTQSPGGQFSSLPLDSTSATYSVYTSGAGVLILKLTIWTNGIYANGYMIASQTAGGPQEIFLLSGQTLGGVLRLHFWGNNAATQNYEMFGYITSDAPVSVGAATIRGTYYVGFVTENFIETGAYTATLIQ